MSAKGELFVWLVGIFLAIYTLTCVVAKMGRTRQAWR